MFMLHIIYYIAWEVSISEYGHYELRTNSVCSQLVKFNGPNTVEGCGHSASEAVAVSTVQQRLTTHYR